MKREEYIQYDGIGLQELLEKKAIKPEEVLQASIDQLNVVNPDINAVARERSRKAEREQAHISSVPNRLQSFSGVPTVLKDLAQTIKGEENIAGSALLQGNFAQSTAYIVDRFKQAGLTPIAYSTTPEFGLKNITEAKVYGPTRNPWNLKHSPGGSSGGSAALISSGVVPIAGASDGGGSIRIPASFSGLFGLKPTRGRTPVGPGAGRQWQGAAIDHVLTKSVRDNARMLDHLQTVQEEAAFQTPLFAAGYENSIETVHNVRYKIGFSVESPVGTPVSAEAKAAVYKTIQWLEEQGHQVEEVAPDIDGKELMRHYYLMNCGEMGALLTDIEKMKGRALKQEELETESWMMYTAGKNVNAAAFSKSLQAWDDAAAKMAAYHENYDLYLTPATAYSAPEILELTPLPNEAASYKTEIEELHADKQQELIYEMFLPSLTYTPFSQLANLTGQPAMSVPVHLTQERLPIGVQMMASKGKEHLLLQIAKQLEDSSIWQGLKGDPYFSSL